MTTRPPIARSDFRGWLVAVVIGAAFVVTLGTIGAVASGRWYMAALTILPYAAIVSVQGWTYRR